ncbi:MAG: tetratricopeptide repeat protein, partial [Flavobacteriaceae bacterium]|nr:tetratricopeptide repeat protein [Flavobacteriaceae bacterium]
YQLTDNFQQATDLLTSQKTFFPEQAYLDVEVGYNLQLQNKKEAAIPYYDAALKSIENNPNTGYLIGKAFQDNHLLDYALKSYERAMELNPNLNYDAYIAFIYGEKGEVENMFNAYLNMIDKNPSYFSTVQRYAGRFLSDDSLDANNSAFRKLLLKRLQTNPNDSWNKLLSWLYMQQKEYGKALVQEKAIYLRNRETLERVIEVGGVAFDNNDYLTTKNAFQYVLENTGDQNLQLEAQLYLLQSNIETATTTDEMSAIELKFKELFDQYGINSNTVDIQIAYADFLTFKKDDPKQAIDILKEALHKTTSEFQKGEVKIKLADVLVYTNQFNQALINYTQVQTKLKNSTLAQQARFKVAQTSYFKGDFKWASTQLKVLKGSTSQLIANDAVDLFLLISDNLGYDSIPKALQLYAKADLLAYQNKNKRAIDSLALVLKNHKGEEIEDLALFKQADLYEKTNQFNKAEENYLKIIDAHAGSILLDNSYFRLGELYESRLKNPEKAKEMYQKIIFEHPSSIYLVDARKRFRKLRGDQIN